jgi:hypothetical protein
MATATMPTGTTDRDAIAPTTAGDHRDCGWSAGVYEPPTHQPPHPPRSHGFRHADGPRSVIVGAVVRVLITAAKTGLTELQVFPAHRVERAVCSTRILGRDGEIYEGWMWVPAR